MNPTRLITLDDVPALAVLVRANREFFAPWEPLREETFFSVDGQRSVVQAALKAREQGTTLPHVILDEAGNVVGRITLNEIVRGPLQSCSLGYSLSATENGRGLATAAVRDIVRLAFEELKLHRIQAGTLPHNDRSQRVLERSGFIRYGLAPGYLKIAGSWQDNVLYQLLIPNPV
jgi:ribosomal-protein-alanine N-acetyltransferase